MIHCNSFISNVITDFYKGHTPVSSSTGLFLLFLNMIHKICEIEQKQMILDIVIIPKIV